MYISSSAAEWLEQAARRRIVLAHLKQPLTPAQLARLTGISLDYCSHTLSAMVKLGLVECVNPEAVAARLFWVTREGRAVQAEQRRKLGLRPLAYDFPRVDWKLYAWACHAHRSAVIKAMEPGVPMQPAAIRLRIRRTQSEVRISLNNVLDVVWRLPEKGIADLVALRGKARPAYMLTEEGRKIRELLFRAETREGVE